MKTLALFITLLALLGGECLAQPFHFGTLTSEEGLSHNSVFGITQDYKGFMWFGTRDGVSRYDSQQLKTYLFNTYSPDVEANRVNCLYAVDRELWVGTAVGLFRYDSGTDKFVQVVLANGPTHVLEIKRMSTGELWVGSRNGIYMLDRQGGVRHILPKQSVNAICEFRKGTFLILRNNNPVVINGAGETIVTPAISDVNYEKAPAFRDYMLYKNQRGTIWMGTNVGLLELDETAMVFRLIGWFNQLTKDRVRVIRTVTEDKAGNLWVGGESGVVVVDKQRQAIQWYDKSFTASPYGLTDRAVYSSCVSRDGIVWLGTYFGGVNYAKPMGVSFNHLFPAADGQSVAGKAISQLVTDGQQRLWIGTEDGGVSIKDQATGQYTYHNRKNGLSDDNVHAIWIDKSGVAWVGTYLGGLNRIDPAAPKRVYKHDPANPASLSNNGVYAIYRDRKNTLWVGTIQGLNQLDEQTDTFRPFKPDVLGKIHIYAIWEDTAGQLWFTTRHKGIYRYDPGSDKLTHYHAGNTPVLRNNQVISVYEDTKRDLWFGSLDGGISQWSYVRQQFVPTPINNYLPSQTVYGVLEDNRGTYWFSTNRGLLSFDPTGQGTYRAFDKSNGLQATQFNFKSYLKDERGLLYFGSVDGLCYFDPDIVTKRVFDPPVYFTDLKLFNKEVKADGKSVLTKHLDETSELRFDYSQNVITLDFVAVNYFSTRTNYYTYYLEGFEETWNPKTTLHSRTYTNLSPGTYTFHVRSFQSNGAMSPVERTIRLVIRPPFWRTPFAYLIYGLLGVGLLLVYRRFITFLNNQKVAVQMERMERQKSEGLNQQKLNFFTFLSNEFRTPITLIMAEIDELIQSNQAWRADSVTNYGVIKKNAKRLQSLIDQITELRKARSDLQKIRLTETDIVAFVKETVQGFDSLLQSRHVHRRLSFSPPYLMASFDAGKTEMITGNVFFFLANEVAEGDELRLDVRVENTPEPTDCHLNITFSLDGQPELFERIRTSYQVAADNDELFLQTNSSSIGLLLTFSLVKLLSGAVSFPDEHGQHSFAIRLPIRKSPVSKATAGPKRTGLLSTQIVSVPDELLTTSGVVNELSDELVPTDKPTILIIDRSKELTQFLKRHYAETYRISLANTFDESLKKAESILPDVILCDSDIRDRDNRSLCMILKNNPLTQTIPVLLLLTDKDDKTITDGLNSGADGYLGKPFNLGELDLMISNKLKSVSVLKTKLVGGLADSFLTTLPRRNKEQEFIMRFSTLVNHQYKDKDTTADQLAQRMNCSRSQLHTKLKTLTGMSTKEYLNDYRLTVARQLLGGGMSVAEAAFEVGFSDPNYFGRAFKRKYGTTPSKAS